MAGVGYLALEASRARKVAVGGERARRVLALAALPLSFAVAAYWCDSDAGQLAGQEVLVDRILPTSPSVHLFDRHTIQVSLLLTPGIVLLIAASKFDFISCGALLGHST